MYNSIKFWNFSFFSINVLLDCDLTLKENEGRDAFQLSSDQQTLHLLARTDAEHLYLATLYNNLNKVKECMLLPNKDALVSTRFVDGLTLLHVAAVNNHEAIARALIESGAAIDINVKVNPFFFFLGFSRKKSYLSC